jgi:hypothetical protein
MSDQIPDSVKTNTKTNKTKPAKLAKEEVGHSIEGAGRNKALNCRAAPALASRPCLRRQTRFSPNFLRSVALLANVSEALIFLSVIFLSALKHVAKE